LPKFTGKQSTRLQKISVPHDFSLGRTLKCGQTFRVFEKGGAFIYPYGGSVLALRQEKGSLFYESFGRAVSRDCVRNLLGLNDDIDAINRALAKRVKGFGRIINSTLGIRIMRQNPFETTISFMFSVQSAIPLIQRRLDMLSEIAGGSVETPYGKFYLFPDSFSLRHLSNKDIKSLKLGFREKWFTEFIEKYDENKMKQISSLAFEEKERSLVRIKGVGIKVAHCIMLFSMDELSAFPVDVWIKRGMEQLFGISGTTQKVTKESRLLFGEFAGYAQEYIYYYMRNKQQIET
jgi:N-glycosylase/DNA lyase